MFAQLSSIMLHNAPCFYASLHTAAHQVGNNKAKRILKKMNKKEDKKAVRFSKANNLNTLCCFSRTWPLSILNIWNCNLTLPVLFSRAGHGP